MLTLLCGMQSEAQVFQGHPELQVLFGTARDSLSTHVAKGCTGLISAGTCGGLLPGLTRGTLVLGVSVTTADGKVYAADNHWLAAVKGKVAHIGYHLDHVYSDPSTIVSTPAQRSALAALHNVAVDDEESWAVAQAAKGLRLPFIVLRAVSDQLDQTLLPDDAKAINPDGTVNVAELIPDFIADPMEAILEAEGLEQALNTLRNTFTALGPAFR